MALQDRKYEVDVPLEDVGGIPLVALQEDMLSDGITAASLRKLTVVADKSGSLVVAIDRQLVIAYSAQPSLGCGPSIMTKLS